MQQQKKRFTTKMACGFVLCSSWYEHPTRTGKGLRQSFKDVTRIQKKAWTENHWIVDQHYWNVRDQYRSSRKVSSR